MTLIPYEPEKLDTLALRLLDLATTLRGMSNACREQAVPTFALHDKKALEWLTRLEDWARETDARLQTALLKQRAMERALKSSQGLPRSDGDRLPRRKKSRA